MSYVPPAAPAPPDPLALDRPKSIGELLRGTWTLWTRNTSVFVVTAALIVVPIEVFVVGVAGRGFYDPRGYPSAGALVVNVLLLAVVGGPMITATHARSVVALAEGRQLTTEDAVKLGVRRFGWVLLAACMMLVLAVLGLVVVFIGAIVVLVYGVFTTITVALDDVTPADAFRTSRDLVADNGFFRTFAYMIVLSAFSQFVVRIVANLIGDGALILGDPSWFGIPAVLLLAAAETVAASWIALAMTLLYFSWKAEARLRSTGQYPPAGPIDAGAGAQFVKPQHVPLGTIVANPGVPPALAPRGPSRNPGGPTFVKPGQGSAAPASNPSPAPSSGVPGAPPQAPRPPAPNAPQAPPEEFPYDDIPPRPKP